MQSSSPGVTTSQPTNMEPMLSDTVATGISTEAQRRRSEILGLYESRIDHSLNLGEAIPSLAGGGGKDSALLSRFERTLNGLRDYQAFDLLDAIHHGGRYHYWYDVGLGKTPVAIAQAQFYRPTRILVSGLEPCWDTWRDMIPEWWPEATIINYRGKAGERIKLLAATKSEGFSPDKPLVVFVGFSMVHEIVDKQRWWDMLIVDEEHRAANNSTRTFKSIEKVQTHRFAGLTASASKQGAKGFYTYFRTAEPESHKSFWNWIKDNVVVYNDPNFGPQLLGPKNPQEFREKVGRIGVRRLKKDHLLDLPGLERIPQKVEINPVVRKIYNDLVDELIAEHGDSIIAVPSKLVLTMRLRQLLLCPKLLGIDQWSGVLTAMAAKGREVADAGHSFVVFTEFTEAIPHISEILKRVIGPELTIYETHGKLSGEKNSTNRAAFQKSKGPSALVANSAMAVSWPATKASYVLFAGLPWGPDVCEQCEGRVMRDGQKNAVQAWYFYHPNSVEAAQLEKINLRNRDGTSILNSPEVLRKL